MTSIGLAELSNGFIYASMVTLAIAMVFFAASFASGRRRSPVAASARVSGGSVAVLEREEVDEVDPGRRSANIGMSLTWLGTILLFGGVVVRGLWAQRVPWGNMYEFSITAALGILFSSRCPFGAICVGSASSWLSPPCSPWAWRSPCCTRRLRNSCPH